MKQLELNQMELLLGSDDFADGFCYGVGATSVAVTIFAITLGPFGALVMAASAVACFEYATNQL